MKKYLNETWSMYVLVFAFCFMLFLYEPLTMYLGNISDFWFGISTMFKMSFLLFLIVFIMMVIGFNIVFLINKKKDKKFYKTCTMIMFIVFFCSYIQGNYLVGNLPLLDGSEIIWSNYKVDWLISLVLWIVAIGLVIFLVKKLTLNKMVKYVGFVGLAIFLMLSVSLSTSILTSKEGIEKDFIPLTTNKDINKYSSDKNFVILLLDCVNSTSFMNQLKKDANFKDMLNDFTYYPDMMSYHGYTDESIPLILTGKIYRNDAPIVEWSTNAYKESYLFDLMEKNGYELDIYDTNLLYSDKSAKRINNLIDYEKNEKLIYNSINKISFWKQEIKYILFRYLPSYLKRFSSISSMSYRIGLMVGKSYRLDNDFFESQNEDVLSVLKKNKISIVDNRVFKFIHTNGAHEPYTTNKNFEPIDNPTYYDAIDSSLSLTKIYLEMLKENNVYDNTVIIIMADHGFRTEESHNGKQNPIFLVKGINETHKGMKTSNKPLSFVDLDGMYEDLILGKNSSELFSTIPDKRVRQYLSYSFQHKEKMIEYETKDKAWETEKMYKTGKVYRKS